jgi:hypothetical protein
VHYTVFVAVEPHGHHVGLGDGVQKRAGGPVQGSGSVAGKNPAFWRMNVRTDRGYGTFLRRSKDQRVQEVMARNSEAPSPATRHGSRRRSVSPTR